MLNEKILTVHSRLFWATIFRKNLLKNDKKLTFRGEKN